MDSPGKNTRCSRCGEDNFEFASFCIGCGEPLDAEGEASDKLKFSPKDRAIPETEPRGRATLAEQARKRRTVETVIGVALVLLALGFAAYQWQRINTQAAAYRAAVVAAGSHNWDSAAVDYLRAGDHPGAVEGRKDALGKVSDRNRLYQQAVQAVSSKDWSTAITTLQDLQAIQPNYRGSASMLAAAHSQALATGLSGLIYLVTATPQPGLYLRDAQGNTVYLEGSDARSRVRATSADGKQFAFDRPVVSTSSSSPTPTTVERAIALARIGSDGKVGTTLIPGLDSNGKGLIGDSGMWWYSPQQITGVMGQDVYYYSPFTGVERLGDPLQREQVVAVDPVRSRVVIAATGRGPGSDYWQTTLYIADGQGQNRKLLQVLPGAVEQASISADGTWFLCITMQNMANLETSVLAIRLGGTTLGANGADPSSVRLLQTLPWNGMQRPSRLNAAFLPDSQAPTKVAVTFTGLDIQGLTVFDLDNGEIEYSWNVPEGSSAGRMMTGISNNGQPTWSTRGGTGPGRHPVAFSTGGRYLVYQQQDGDESLLGISGMHTEPGAPPVGQVRVENPSGRSVEVRFSPGGDYLVVGVETPDSSREGRARALYTVRLVANDSGGPLVPIPLGTAHIVVNADMPTMALPAGGIMIAYMDPEHALHATFYDGTGDIELAHGVRAVWSLPGETDATPSR